MPLDIERFQKVVQRYPRTIIVTSLLALPIPWLVNNYRAYIALGPGGLPYNVFGWLIALAAKPFGRETKSTAEYDADPNKDSWLTKPDSIPERRGARPTIGWHPAPHRQLDRIPSDAMKQKLDAIFSTHASSNPLLIQVATSPHERRNQAMLIHPSISSPHYPAEKCLREIAHIHPADHSLHLVLSPQDCKIVIERGWGERHPWSGASLAPVSKEYLLIYAPRDDEELAMVERIIVASIGFMANSREVN